jgi:SAM-dependent methyltransferase
VSDVANLLKQDAHFAFGKNWASYAQLLTESRVQAAVDSLRKLAGGDLQGKRFLDIGCGSGLHALAALRLGAREVIALDIDADSVRTTEEVLHANAAGQHWTVRQASIFDLEGDSLDKFDVVYSWGVLHHTGDMDRALRAAAALVAPQGRFIFALYRRTFLCWLWKVEKRWYAGASPAAQSRARGAYVGLFRLAFPFRKERGRFRDYVAGYGQQRGMDFDHDVHDWLGGWPYESISPQRTERLMASVGLYRVRAFTLHGIKLGLFGSGCDEYVYARS